MADDEVEEIKVTVPLSELLELLRLITKIEYPSVTYEDNNLVMAQQAIRNSKRYANEASAILYQWTHTKEEE